MASIFPQGVSLPDMTADISREKMTDPIKVEPLSIDILDKDIARVSGLHVERRVEFEMKAIHEGSQILDEEDKKLAKWNDYWRDNNQVTLPPLS